MPAISEADAAPLRGLDLQRQKAATYYGGGLVLSRPDLAWRCDGVSADSLALIDRVRGAASQSSEAASGRAVPMAQASFAAIDSIKDTS